MVAPAGIEPTTNGLGNRCSIQLSYGAATQVDGPTVPRRVLAVNAEVRCEKRYGALSPMGGSV